MKRRLCTYLVALALPLAGAAVAHASNPAAESAFQAGVDAMKAGDFKTACARLDASQKLEPRSGTLLLLASCHEQRGQIASAWTEYKDAATLADSENRKENAQKGRDAAAALAPKVSYLRIDATSAEGLVLVVKLDGQLVPEGTFGTDVAVDPGPHTLVASAAGRQDWTHPITVGAEADRQVVKIPVLEKAATVPAPAPLPAPGIVPAPTPKPGSGPGGDEGASGGIPAWAWGVGATGLVLTGVSIAFRVLQSQDSARIEDACGADRQSCPADYDFDSDYEAEKRDFALFLGLGVPGVVGIVTGIAGIAVGASSGSSSEAAESALAPMIDVGPSGGVVGVGGRF